MVIRKKSKQKSKVKRKSKSTSKSMSKTRVQSRVKKIGKTRKTGPGKKAVARRIVRITRRKPVHRTKRSVTQRTKTRTATAPTGLIAAKPAYRMVEKPPSRERPIVARHPTPAISRSPHKPPVDRREAPSRTPRIHQFTYMKAPGFEHAFEVGDSVEVFCDHEKNHERIRGWVKGIVVQVDNKMVAVQFRSNVFLTDGWMVPDRILWYPLNSEHIRPQPGKKPMVKDFLPEY